MLLIRLLTTDFFGQTLILFSILIRAMRHLSLGRKRLCQQLLRTIVGQYFELSSRIYPSVAGLDPLALTLVVSPTAI